MNIVDALMVAQYYVGLVSDFVVPGVVPEKSSLTDYYVPIENTVIPAAPGYTLPIQAEYIHNYADMDFSFNLETARPLLEQNGFTGYVWSESPSRRCGHPKCTAAAVISLSP